MSGLPRPLPKMLTRVAQAMVRGALIETVDDGKEVNYHQLLTAKLERVIGFLEFGVGRLSTHRCAMRVAASSLEPSRCPSATILRLVVCDPFRPDEEVSELRLGDKLYVIVAEDRLGRGFMLTRLA